MLPVRLPIEMNTFNFSLLKYTHALTALSTVVGANCCPIHHTTPSNFEPQLNSNGKLPTDFCDPLLTGPFPNRSIRSFFVTSIAAVNMQPSDSIRLRRISQSQCPSSAAAR